MAERRSDQVAAVLQALREMTVQLGRLNQVVGGLVELNAVDLECLDVIDRAGEVSPTELARRVGLHPATMTGILDRLERGGWVERSRHADDRRRVLVRVIRDRGGELRRLYGPMLQRMARICAGYPDDELELLRDFLTRCRDAGRAATADLATGAAPGEPAGGRSAAAQPDGSA
jgi:DNA-binding MarR family transcriptional regulator